MQLTKFTKTLNGITPSLAVVSADVPPSPSATLNVPLHFSSGKEVALITDRGKKPGKWWRYIAFSTRSVVDAWRWLRKSATDDGENGKGWCRCREPEVGAGERGWFVLEEGCYWHGGCRVVGHLGVPRSPRCHHHLLILLHLVLFLFHSPQSSSSHSLCTPSRPKDILVSPCWVTFGLRAQPNLPGGRPGLPFSTNPSNELRGSRGLLVAMATEPSPNPLDQTPISIPRYFTTLFLPFLVTRSRSCSS